jgi:antitoxin MazE
MQAYIQKWGNSLGLRIPLHIAKQLNLHQGSPVTLEIDHGRIIIQPPIYCLDTMLEEINSKNKYHPLLDDKSKGNEEW